MWAQAALLGRHLARNCFYLQFLYSDLYYIGLIFQSQEFDGVFHKNTRKLDFENKKKQKKLDKLKLKRAKAKIKLRTKESKFDFHSDEDEFGFRRLFDDDSPRSSFDFLNYLSSLAIQHCKLDRILTVKHIELTVAYLHAMYNSISLSHMMSISLLFFHNFYDGSVCQLIHEYFTHLFLEPSADLEEQAGFNIQSVKAMFALWREIKDSEFVTRMTKMFALCVSAGMCKLADIPFGKETFERFYKKSGVDKITKLDMVEQMLETSIFIYEKMSFFVTTGDFRTLFYSDNSSSEFEYEYTNLVSTLNLLQTGNLARKDFDEHSYEDRVDKLIDTTKQLIRLSRGVEKKVFSDKLLRLEQVKVSILEYQKAMTLRERPFSFLLFGDSGGGKSTMLPLIINALLIANGIEPKEELTVTLQANDPFQSEYRTKHNVVILDDIANATPQHSDVNPNNVIINFNNNIPACALSPIAELKGKIMIAPKFFIGTTNRKDMFASIYSTEPISIVRRFDFTITVTVKEEYAKHGRLNTALVDGFDLDAWEFRVEVPYATSRAASQIKGIAYEVVKDGDILLDKCSYGHLIGFLARSSRKHFEEQKKLIGKSSQAYGTQLCAHFSYPNICPSCLSNQAGPVVNLGQIVKFFNQIPSYCQDSVFGFGRRISSFRLGRLIVSSNCFKNIISFVVFITFFYTTAVYSAVGYFMPIHSWTQFFLLYCANLLVVFYFFTCCVVRAVESKLSTFPIQYFKQKFEIDRSKMIKFSQIVLVISALFALKKFYKMFRLYQTSSQGSEFKIPEAGEDEKVNIWNRVAPTSTLVSDELHNMTFDQAASLVKKNIAHATFSSAERLKGCACDIFPLKSGVWIAPWHVMKRGYSHVHVARVSPDLIGPNFESKLGESSFVRIGCTDLCLVYLPVGGSTRDLTKLFPLTLNNKSVAANLMYKDSLGNITESKFNAVPFIFLKDDVKYDALRYNCGFETFSGLCMAPLMCMGKLPYIAGFHLAGRTGHGDGVAQRLTVRELEEALVSLESKPMVMKMASETNMDFSVPELRIKHLEDVHPKSPVNFMPPSTTLTILGGHTGERRKFTSEVVPTLISDQVSEQMGIPKQHGPPMNIGNYRPWRENLVKLGNPKKLNPDILEKAFVDLRAKIFNYLEKNPQDKRKIHPINNITNLSGADGVYGIDAIQKSTSSGWPWNRPKSTFLHFVDPEGTGATYPVDCDPEFWEEVEEKAKTLAAGKRVNLIWRANLKDEPTSLGKEKVRVFAGSPFVGLVLFRRYFLTTCKYIMEHSVLFECAVGVNAYGPEWTELSRVMMKFGKDRVVAGDYKDYDSSMPCEITLAAMKLLIEICEWAGYNEEQLAIMAGLATEVCLPIYEYNGTFLQICGSNPSGHSLTVFLNNIVNSLYLRYAYYDIYSSRNSLKPFHEVVSVMCYGDDNKMSVAKGFDEYNHTAIAKSLAQCGIVYTMADKEAESVPFIDSDDCTFLKRSSVWSEKYKNFLAPLELKSIAKTLHCVLKSKFLNIEEQTVECVTNCMMEFWYHGEEVYNERRLQLLKICDEAGLLPYFENETIATFAQVEEKYCKQWDIQL